MKIYPSLLLSVLLATFSMVIFAQDVIKVSPGRYDIISTIVLPNLDENLTNSKTRDIVCLKSFKPTHFFPILSHPSFTQCELIDQKSNPSEGKQYRLKCHNSQAASGGAVISISADRITAQINIKMGAKNMTMTQNVNALKISRCERLPSEEM